MGLFYSRNLDSIEDEDKVLSDYDYFVVLPWHFKEFFLSNKRFKNKNLIFPLPTPEMIKLNEAMNIESRIYVAGHKGLVGSSIVRRLKDGYKNIITRSREELDLMDTSKVNLFFKNNKIDYVFDAVARVGGIHANDYYSGEFIYQNTVVQNNLIHHAHLYDVKKFIFLGSVCIYPKYASTPVKEEALLTGE